MCGRFSLGLPHNEIEALLGYPDAHVGEWVNQDQFVPRYNIAPHSQASVIRRSDAGPSSQSGSSRPALIMQTMKWGLVPHWNKHEDATKTLNTINARAENLVEGGGMWASIKGKKRCAVVCQGYYEWLKKGKDRIPHFTKLKGDKLMLMAGLWDVAHLEGQEKPLYTFTIVTTDASKQLSWLHDRQSVILTSEADLNVWLDTSSQSWTPELTKLVAPYHGSPLECYAVPKEVGKVGTESPTFIQPVAQRKDGIQAMFSKQARSASVKRKRSPSPLPGSSQQPLEGTSDQTRKTKLVKHGAGDEVGKSESWTPKIEAEEVKPPVTPRKTPVPKSKGSRGFKVRHAKVPISLIDFPRRHRHRSQPSLKCV
ncbi:hypothetical protein JAAARDRAFT_38145 [Jaapia argillacea MUCL 33604]|uniref:DUF159-domain-containing protein n=1 Tax=Jaapia argillacea MUCL 33604 TaxID=933084 RepID=A0A067PI82_9AGAM|nr:hypothetical protein JAAARDRAFT_38145 [Jaapia argillacea MUCL 33604]